MLPNWGRFVILLYLVVQIMSILLKNDSIQIREVWNDNLEEVFALISDIIDDYPFLIGVWYQLWSSSSTAETFMTITKKLLHSTWWAESGHVILSSQIQLPIQNESIPHVIKVKNATFSTEITKDAIKVSNHKFWEIKFNKCTCAIDSWTVEGTQVMQKGILPCFWWPPTNNDKGGESDSYLSRLSGGGGSSRGWRQMRGEDVVHPLKVSLEDYTVVLQRSSHYPAM